MPIPKMVNQRRDMRTDEQKKKFNLKTRKGRNKSEKPREQWQSHTLHNSSQNKVYKQRPNQQ